MTTELCYCMRCKNKTNMKNISEKTTTKGQNMLTGNCTVCDCKVNKFVKKAKSLVGEKMNELKDNE